MVLAIEMEAIAVIPARGGSKRIPRKNVRLFNGRPLIQWPIEEAVGSGLFAAVLVSTDDEEIAEIATAAGAVAPFRRPAPLADDHAPTVPVVKHAIEWWCENRAVVDSACCIYPTAPLLVADDLCAARRLIESDLELDYAIGITSYAFPVHRSITLDAESKVRMLWPEHVQTRSQDLPEVWHDAGQFYWGRRLAWINERPFFTSNAAGVRLPRKRVQDIDTQEDWEQAEALAQIHLKG